MDLNALSDFIAVAAHGGFGAASRLTGIPKPTISRRIAQLERQLGYRLLERGRSGMRLTSEGLTLFEHSRPLVAALAELPMSNAIPSGNLRISVPTLLAHAGFGRFAASYRFSYPAVRLEVVAEDRTVDPVREGYDLVLRADPNEADGLIGRKLLSDRLVLAARADTSTDPLPLVSLSSAQSEVTVRTTSGQRIIRVETAMCLSTQMMIRDAVLDGAGAGILPVFLVQEAIDQGQLVSFGELARPPVEIWTLYPAGLPVGARLRSMLTHLEANLVSFLR